ncbi:hypothetical protein JMA_27070 [Jeotgalibacillus malaysiensis]|uniref:Uncharacterized protein n=1 Tax=Jeotgalibacillus malaysiensis TaxID=1508404 RepID=A0A0B5AVJ8_9BACL|nr:hypothetical protein [Jeotgalibacillus malaysiensis]AJD92024.1 hypothetical protein JMA_27070 [Jeotgalibacillus malaysiensis]
MDGYVQVFINVDNEGFIKNIMTGISIVAQSPYDYYFYLPEEEANSLGRARVFIDENMKPQLIKEGE